MNDITILTVEDLKEMTAVSNAVNAELIEPFINSAEIFWIKPTLGDAFWTEIKDAISGNTLSGTNYTFVTEYVMPVSAWFSYYEAAPFIMYRSEAKGITKKSSDNSDALDRKEFEAFRQAILDKAQAWKNRMIDHLIDNSSLYPNWRTEGSSTKGNSSGIFLGI